MESDKGNLYKPHVFMINSGQFWRCAHGSTGFGEKMKWVGCKECATEDPAAYRKFHKLTSVESLDVTKDPLQSKHPSD